MKAQSDKRYSTLQEALVDYQAMHLKERAEKTGFWHQSKVVYNKAGYYEVRNLGIIERLLTLINVGPASERGLIEVAQYRNEKDIPKTVYKTVAVSRSLFKDQLPEKNVEKEAPVFPFQKQQTVKTKPHQESTTKEIAPTAAPQEQAYEAKVDAFLQKLIECGWEEVSNFDKVKREIIDKGTLNIRSDALTALPPEIGDLNLNRLIIECSKLENLPSALFTITNLKILSIRAENLTSLPSEIGQLKLLESLFLHTDNINKLPDELGNLKMLSRLTLGYFAGKELPSVIGQLSGLKELELWGTKIQSICPDIGKLDKLKTLKIWGNHKLTSLPEEIGNLRNLKELHSGSNARLAHLPSGLWTLTGLEQLSLDFNPQLAIISPDIGKLTSLKELGVQGNHQFRTLPREIGNLVNLRSLDVRDMRLAEYGDGETTVGKEELYRTLPSRCYIDEDEEDESVEEEIELMPHDTTRKQVYDALDNQPVRINRAQFVKALVPEIPGVSIQDGDEFLEEFYKVISKLNFDDNTASSYLSYELLSGNSAGLRKPGDNWELIRQKILPRLTGYFKQLYDLPLDDDETAGWQMYDEVKPMMKKALSYILKQLVTLDDSDQRAALFIQFVDGMIHCPTGQKEGIDTVILALLEKKTERSSNLQDLVGKVIAEKKNTSFTTAILGEAARSPQNVHLISSYKGMLQKELGLSNILGFDERIGIVGIDPFNNNQNNALQVYYTLVTPQRLVDWILDKTPSAQDLALRQDLDKLLSQRASLEQKSSNPTLEKKLDNLKTQLQNSEADKALIESQMKQLEALLNAQKAHMPSPSPEALRDLNSKISFIKSQLRIIDQFKPLSQQVILEYLRDGNFIDTQNPNWWQDYFTADPTLQQTATLTRPGALLLLTHLGYVLSE
ncbi:MAG: hypothetical protein JSR37_03675 [Verrucomicrobia bacterium]|nr:hypothetical protein [Verrucomicrobiota bacterium]MBS0637794.1 hypothetical protein [Verrucomicrobiota bacterium]